MVNDWFEVAKDGSIYDAGFNPSEPRNEKGEWTTSGKAAKGPSSGALFDAFNEFLSFATDLEIEDQDEFTRGYPKGKSFKEQIDYMENVIGMYVRGKGFAYALKEKVKIAIDKIIEVAKEKDKQIKARRKRELENAFHDGHYVLYHGTTSEAIESIKKNGLIPHGGKGADVWGKMHGCGVGDFTVGDREASVFVSGSRGPQFDMPSVDEFAEMAAEVTGGRGVILKIDLPKSYGRALQPDERIEVGLRFKGKIKPEWITVLGEAHPKHSRAEMAEAIVKDADTFTVYAVIMCDNAEVSKDRAYDRGFNPNEPRDWHGKWSKFAEEAQKAYLEKHPRTHSETVALIKEFDEWVEDAKYFVNERDWYNRHKSLAKKLFRDKEPIFEKILAATSIQQQPGPNVHDAVLAMEYYLTHGNFEGYTRGMKLSRGKLKEIIELGEVVGPKITPFSKNLQGDWEVVTVDRWMRRLFFKNPIERGGKQQETQNIIVRNAVISMAKSIGWKPAELQAVLWNASRYHGGDFNFNLEDFGKHLEKEAAGIRSFLDAHKIAHDAAPLNEATVVLAKMFLDLLDKAIMLFEKIGEFDLQSTQDMTIGVQFETSKENPNSFTERALGISEANKGENEFERQRRYNTFAGNKAATDSMVGAGIALIDPDGNALFVKRSNHSDHPGHWAFPGGKINTGESHVEAAERETIEETGFVPMGEYEGEIETNNPVPFKTFLKSVESQFEPEWLMEHTEHKWASLANPPSPLHPGVKQAIAKMRGAMDYGFDPNEPRDEHGRWIRGSAIPKKYKTFTEYEEAMKANEPELPLNLPKESRENDWRINQLNEQDVAEEDEQDGRSSIDSDFPNMKNYEVVGPQDGEYNCIAWAFGFEDKWWNPCAYSIAEVDKVMQDYSTDIKYRQGTRDFINQPPRPGRVKIAAFEKNGRFCHMTRQLPDGRWTSKFGGNLKTVQDDLTEMEGGMYGEITRLYDMPIKEFSRFRKERRHNNDMYAWLDKDAD